MVKNNKEIKIIEIDKYYEKVRSNLLAHHVSNDKFYNIFLHRLIARLNRTPPEQIVIVDDILPNVYEYIHRVRTLYKIVLLSTSLQRLYKNLIARGDRPAGIILSHLMTYYRPSQDTEKCKLCFRLRHLDLFARHLKKNKRSIVSTGIRRSMARMRNLWFQNGVLDRICLEPIVFVDEHIIVSVTSIASTVKKLMPLISHRRA
jgi:hypothetical protein